MRETGAETKFLGMRKDKAWTYIIVGAVIIGLFIVLNFVIGDYASAKSGVKKFLSLPGWLYPVIIGGVGLVLFWLGLKIEADWPEVLGSGLIAIAAGVAEIMIGWRKFALGGLTIVAILIPLVVFLVFIGIGMAKSK